MNRKNYTRETAAEARHVPSDKRHQSRRTSGGYSLRDCREAVGMRTHSEKAPRQCLRCEGVFMSEHKFNRTCERCRTRKAVD